jgi:AhpD family alkylhydroperoxidase
MVAMSADGNAPTGVVTTDDLGKLKPDMFGAFRKFGAAVAADTKLPARLLELVRLRVAFHNQCRPCMSQRYEAAIEDGLTEDLVCSLEKPDEPSDMTAAERAAVKFADKFASNHLSITVADRANLEEHFTREEVAELALRMAMFTGFGRMGAVFDTGGEFPVGHRHADGTRLTPWGIKDPMVMPQKRT